MPAPHGGRLCRLLDAGAQADPRLPVIKLAPAQQADVEMLLTGAYSPLAGFMGRDDYLAVLQTRRLADGTVWPAPVVLDVSRAILDSIGAADRALLLDSELNPVAVMTLGEYWQPDLRLEARIFCGTDDPCRDGARRLLRKTAPFYLAGKLAGIQLPVERRWPARADPEVYRSGWERSGSPKILAHFPRGIIHPGEAALLGRALEAVRAERLLLLLGLEARMGGSLAREALVDGLNAALPRLAGGRAVSLGLLRHRSAGCGWKETLLEAIVAQNFGVGALLVPGEGIDGGEGREAGAGRKRSAREELEELGNELGVRLVFADDLAGPGNRPAPASECDRALRMALETGASGDESRAYPEVVDALRRHYPVRHEQGLTLFLTGLSGAGKSSLAHELGRVLEGRFRRRATVLDGDYSRQWLTSDLGADDEGQWANVVRHGRVAEEITRHGGIAILALVAPDAAARAEVRNRVAPRGGFVEIHLSAPPEICESREGKGIYARSRAGIFKGLPGVDRSYDAPRNPELRVDTGGVPLEGAVTQVVDYLVTQGYLREPISG